jgi:hypothetical protein
MHKFIHPDQKKPHFYDHVNGLKYFRNDKSDFTSGVEPQDRHECCPNTSDKPRKDGKEEKATADASRKEKCQQKLVEHCECKKKDLRQEKRKQSAINETVCAMRMNDKVGEEP